MKRINSQFLANRHFKQTPLNKSGAGFTLIEIIVVMGMLAAIGSLVSLASLDTWRGFLFRGDKDLVVNALQKARSQAINNICLGEVPVDQSQCSLPEYCCDGKSHGVHFESGKYVIFQGTAYDPNDSKNEILTPEGNTQITNLTSSEIVFSQLSGDVDAVWSINLKDNVGHVSTTTVNRAGRIDW